MQSNDIGAKDSLARCLTCYVRFHLCLHDRTSQKAYFLRNDVYFNKSSIEKAQMPNGLEIDYFFALDSTRNLPDFSMSSGIRGHAYPSRKNTSPNLVDERISEPLTTAQPKSPSTHTAWHSE
jgi:hypothetical protein